MLIDRQVSKNIVSLGVEYNWMLRKQTTQKLSDFDSMLDNQSNQNLNASLINKSLRKQDSAVLDENTPTLVSKKMPLLKKVSIKSHDLQRVLSHKGTAEDKQRESFYTDRQFRIEEIKNDDDTPKVATKGDQLDENDEDSFR